MKALDQNRFHKAWLAGFAVLQLAWLWQCYGRWLLQRLAPHVG